MKECNLSAVQKRHRQFVVEMGWNYSKSALESVALIHEEAAELGHELRKKEVSWSNVGDEMADIILRVIDLAGELGVDIDEAVTEKVNKNFANIDEIKAKGRRV